VLLVHQSLSLHTGNLFTHGNLQNKGHDGWESFDLAGNLKSKGLLYDKNTNEDPPAPPKKKLRNSNHDETPLLLLITFKSLLSSHLPNPTRARKQKEKDSERFQKTSLGKKHKRRPIVVGKHTQQLSHK